MNYPEDLPPLGTPEGDADLAMADSVYRLQHPTFAEGSGEACDHAGLCGCICNYCGETATAGNPIHRTMVSPPISGHDTELVDVHSSCGAEWARDMAI